MPTIAENPRRETGNLAEAVLLFPAECREAEERFVSAALQYPGRAVAAAERNELTREAFIYSDTRFCFDVATCAAECGSKLVTLDQLRQLNATFGHPIPEHPAVAYATPHNQDGSRLTRLYFLEITSTGLDVWARDIVEAHRRRLRAQELLAEAERVLGGVESIDSIARRMVKEHKRRFQRVTLPKRPSKRRSVRTARKAVVHV